MSAKTLQEIAERLNISRRTISRVLKNDKNVAGDTRARVLKYFEKEKYFPNVHAASLALKKSNVIGLIFPKSIFINADFFVTDTIKGVAEAIEGNDYQLMIFTQDKFNNDQCLKLYNNKSVGGLILVAIAKEDMARCLDLRKNQVPVSLLFSYSKEFNSFGCDNKKGGYLATKHLIDSGRRNIAFIHGHENWFDAQERYEGYKRALAEAEMEFKPEYVERGYFSYEGGVEAMKRLLALDKPPDGVFAANDRMAIGTIRTVKTSGKKVPDDIAVAGFDNIPLCELFDPAITTIEQPVKDIAYAAAKALLDSIASLGEERKAQIRLFEPKLIIRNSG